MNHNINIKIGNEIIECVNKTNFLGLIIDDDLSWRHHIIKVTSKISKLYVGLWLEQDIIYL